MQFKSSPAKSLRRAHIPKQVEAAAGILLCRSGGELELLGKFLAFKTGLSSEHLRSWASKLMAWYSEFSENGTGLVQEEH